MRAAVLALKAGQAVAIPAFGCTDLKLRKGRATRAKLKLKLPRREWVVRSSATTPTLYLIRLPDP